MSWMGMPASETAMYSRMGCICGRWRMEERMAREFGIVAPHTGGVD